DRCGAHATPTPAPMSTGDRAQGPAVPITRVRRSIIGARHLPLGTRMTDADALLVTGESALRERGQARVTWTPTFIAYLAYLFIIVTYKFGVATVMMVVALASLFLASDRVRLPRFPWWFAVWGVLAVSAC